MFFSTQRCKVERFKLIYAPCLKCKLWGEGSKLQWHAGVIWYCIFDICVWYLNLVSKLQWYVCEFIVLFTILMKSCNTRNHVSHVLGRIHQTFPSFCILECIEKIMRVCFHTYIWFPIQVHVSVSKHLFLVFGALKLIPSFNKDQEGLGEFRRSEGYLDILCACMATI